jgi:flagella basal body P-ring formation protein FlgA
VVLKFSILITLIAEVTMLAVPLCARALESQDQSEQEEYSAPAEQFADMLRREASKQYPGASVSIDKELHWTRGQLPEDFKNVSIQGETPRGELMFAVSNPNTHRESTGWVGFAAWTPAWFAIRRIHPGEKLTQDMFTRRDVNVASGQGHEYRGVILEAEAKIDGLEARQTVLEGQFLVSSAVQRTPDIRRGDAVRVQVISNGLALSTLGTAEEPAYLDGNVRVMAGKAKRELLGKLLPGGIVEVKL